MALTQNRLVAGVADRLHSYANARFARFMGVSAVALTTSLTVLAICDGVLHLTSVPSALASQIGGALVSYVLSRWAWERKGKPDVLRETIPFWIVFGVATVISTLATKLGYVMARTMHLHAFRQVLLVEGVYLLANIATFLMRFVIFHYILFADRKTVPGDVAIGLDVPAETAPSPSPAEVPEPAAVSVVAMASSSATRLPNSLKVGGRAAMQPGHAYELRSEISSDSAMWAAWTDRSPSPSRSRACRSSRRELVDGLCGAVRSGAAWCSSMR